MIETFNLYNHVHIMSTKEDYVEDGISRPPTFQTKFHHFHIISISTSRIPLKAKRLTQTTVKLCGLVICFFVFTS